MLLNCGTGLEKTLESHLDYTEIKPFNLKWKKKTPLNIHWKDWCWSLMSNTLATWCKEPTHWKKPWCWERLKAREGGDSDAGWHHWLNGQKSKSESHSVVSDSLWPHGLYGPRNSPGQNPGVSSLSLFQRIFQSMGWTQVSCIAGGFFTSWATWEAHEHWSG